MVPAPIEFMGVVDCVLARKEKQPQNYETESSNRLAISYVNSLL
ncbi:MAG TPA: hypothetical protein VFI73_12220 [Candidatus Nitrosopolaris sp.]|nr:hypothetical protein [Candidatus Nitrosopolaris sp.]